MCVISVYIHVTITTIKIQDYSTTTKIPLLLSLCSNRHSLPPTICNLWQPLTCFYYYNFIISRILNKWSHTVWDPWAWLFFFFFHPAYALDIVPKGCVHQYSFIFISEQNMNIPWLIIHLLRDILVVFGFWILQIRWLRAIMCRCLCWN